MVFLCFAIVEITKVYVQVVEGTQRSWSNISTNYEKELEKKLCFSFIMFNDIVKTQPVERFERGTENHGKEN